MHYCHGDVEVATLVCNYVTECLTLWCLSTVSLSCYQVNYVTSNFYVYIVFYCLSHFGLSFDVCWLVCVCVLLLSVLNIHFYVYEAITILYCVVLYCIIFVLSCLILYCIVLYCKDNGLVPNRAVPIRRNTWGTLDFEKYPRAMDITLINGPKF